ncbi:MAG: hypothetical protein HGGPFJEG_03076 [Ignavibacteria bacterium]|nr:hypothetical protein [Ignavibacteria bacterium]
MYSVNSISKISQSRILTKKLESLDGDKLDEQFDKDLKAHIDLTASEWIEKGWITASKK